MSSTMEFCCERVELCAQIGYPKFIYDLPSGEIDPEETAEQT